MDSSRTIWQSFRSSIDGPETSRQLAAGMVFGCLIGLIPKDSVICILLIFLAILSSANLVTAVVSTVVFGFVGITGPVQELAHRIGLASFESRSLQPYLISFFEFPGMAWTRLENSIVFGSLIFGMALAIPTYLISFRLFERYRGSFTRALEQKKMLRWMTGQVKLDAARGE